jgi:hypothetical protein
MIDSSPVSTLTSEQNAESKRRRNIKVNYVFIFLFEEVIINSFV